MCDFQPLYDPEVLALFSSFYSGSRRASGDPTSLALKTGVKREKRVFAKMQSITERRVDLVYRIHHVREQDNKSKIEPLR